MYKINLRTVYRDIGAINQAGIPIVSYRGANGGFGIMEKYENIEACEQFLNCSYKKLLLALKSTAT
jgi:predicted DNA-binding transcriptional regulator YafY